MIEEIDRAKIIERFIASQERHPFLDEEAVLTHFSDDSGIWPGAKMSDRLRDLLKAPLKTPFTPQDLRRIIRAQYIEKALGGQGDWIGEIDKVAGHIGGQTSIRRVEDDEWDEIADLGRALYVLEGDSIPEEMRDSREKAVAAAAARIMGRGITPSLDNLDLNVSDDDVAKATLQIQSLLDFTGVEFAVKRTLEDLKQQGRRGDIYLSGRRSDLEKKFHAPPLHFILQLAMKSPAVGTSSQPEQDFNKARSLATDLLAVMDVEPFSQFDDMFVNAGNLIKRLRDLALFDACHSLRQWRPEDARFILMSFFSSVDGAKLKAAVGWDVGEALDLLDGVFNVALTDGSTFSRGQLERSCSADSDLGALLAHFAHEMGKVNSGLVSPLSDADALFKPLIEIAPDRYMLVSRSCAGPAFYEAIQSGVRKAFGEKYASDLSGNGTERVVKDLFANAGIAPLVVNELYDMGDAGDGECDLVYGNDGLVVFTETKAKPLTRATMGGKPGEALLDLAGGMFAGQLQALHHEKLLRTSKRLKFQSGDHIALDGRSIIKLSITLLDHGALQDRVLLRMFYETLLNLRYASVPGFKKTGQVNKLNAIIAKVVKDILDLQSLGCSPIEEVKSTASLNVGLLAIILGDCKASGSKDVLSDFCDRVTEPVTYGTFNPMTEYLFGRT